MSNLLMGMAVKTWFALTSRNKAPLQIRKYLDKYLALAGLTNDECGALSVFGEFDGHDWHCMFRFHLLIHYKQAAYVVRKACAEQGNKVSSVPIPTHG
jgi:hypothetical protein